MVVFLIIIAIPAIYFGRRLYTYVSALQEEHTLRRNLVVLKAEIEVLRIRLNEYKRGTLLEAKARDDLGMIKKGEKVYLVPK
jgi:cell division protein FtsB